MPSNSDKRFAVLIDAENISDKYIKFILDEISSEGEATYKRIYGDWTKPSLAPWKKVLLEYSVMPVQQYSYTQGKNSSDSAMIIDAMDILYSGRVEGFCLCTSDSDFTRLAVRLRESGMIVVGMGEKKTPKAFTSACNRFKYLDLISAAAKAQARAEKKQNEKQEKFDKAQKDAKDKAPKIVKRDEKPVKGPELKKPEGGPISVKLPSSAEEPRDIHEVHEIHEANEIEKAPEKDPKTGKFKAEDLGIVPLEEEEDQGVSEEVTSLEEIRNAIIAILNEDDDEDGWVSTSDLGNRLIKRYSDFDVRNYGYTKLTPFLKSLKGFEMMSVRNENSNVKHVFLREYQPDRDKTDD
ncbi:MAG: NYN domain-containing protein [Firmicutes bacterium]|nr:NYN domain-containing protein [Bacillota bacterium]